MNAKNKNLLTIMIIFLVILCNSIVYSALNTEMFINGDAHIRVDKDIRITDVKVVDQVNGAYETYNSDYSKNTTSMQVSLPSSESFMIYEVTITNKGDIDYEVTNIIEESYSNSNIKYELIDIENGSIIDKGTTHKFKIKFTTPENNTDNKTTIVLKYTFKEWMPSLYNMVVNKSRGLDTDIDFGVAPTKETSGIYKMNSTKDSEYPVYYYRGIIDNNNVSFAGFCWKIVRTTETGGVKLIYNGIPGSDGSCNNTEFDTVIGLSEFNINDNYNAYEGYMYGVPNSNSYNSEFALTNDSTIKIYLDNWYSNNIIDYTSSLEDTIWCNDKSFNLGTGYGNEITDYNGSYRAEKSHIPSLNCINNGDRFTVSSDIGNKSLKFPVGLLTVDELMYAGAVYQKTNNTQYLFNNYSFYTMTPWSFYPKQAREVYLKDDGSITFGNVSISLGVRPTVSLKKENVIKKGTGSVIDPYIILKL